MYTSMYVCMYGVYPPNGDCAYKEEWTHMEIMHYTQRGVCATCREEYKLHEERSMHYTQRGESMQYLHRGVCSTTCRE